MRHEKKMAQDKKRGECSVSPFFLLAIQFNSIVFFFTRGPKKKSSCPYNIKIQDKLSIPQCINIYKNPTRKSFGHIFSFA